MANDNPLFDFSPFNFDHELIQGFYVPISDHHQIEPIDIKVKKNNSFGMEEDFGDHHKTTTDHHDDHQFGFYQHKGLVSLSQDQQQQQQHHHQDQDQAKANYSIFDDFDANSVFSQAQLLPIQDISTIGISTTLDHLPCATRNSNIRKKIPSQAQTPFASLELLSSYRSGFNKLINVGKSTIIEAETGSQLAYTSRRGGQKIPTEEIMRIAGARYIEFSNNLRGGAGRGLPNYYAPVDHPFGYALSGLSEAETKDVELVHLLLATAEKVGHHQFDRATTLLRNCEIVASSKANPVERIVSFFAQALWDKIERETGGLKRRVVFDDECEIDEIIAQGLSTNLLTLSYHQQVPFLQVMQFPAVQAILEAFESATKLHLIDLEIRSGIQWTGLMQALAAREDRPVELLKLTAVGVKERAEKIDETRKRLTSLAESLNLPFAFNSVIVSNMDDVTEAMFDVENDAALAVHSLLLLRTMISRPKCLENLMRVVANLKPSLMTVVEVEADHNSPSFSRRFIEALFFYGAFFDCVDACIKGRDFRAAMEAVLGVGIRNIVAAEGAERVNRNVRIGVWRAFFARFGMVEMKLSESCYYQASLVAKQFGCGGSCTLDWDGKSLMVGWKGTPIHSLSAWKFL